MALNCSVASETSSGSPPAKTGWSAWVEKLGTVEIVGWELSILASRQAYYDSPVVRDLGNGLLVACVVDAVSHLSIIRPCAVSFMRSSVISAVSVLPALPGRPEGQAQRVNSRWRGGRGHGA
jgi:hypothetical protein